MTLTPSQRHVLLTLARVYVGLSRPTRALLLLHPLHEAEPNDVEMGRIALAAYLLLNRTEDALSVIDRLIEHEASARDLAFALAMRSRLLARRGERAAARAAWSEYVALCRVSRLSVGEALE